MSAAKKGDDGSGKVLVLLGSDSDRPAMEKGLKVLEDHGIEHTVRVSSTHRDPEGTAELARTAESRGFEVIICGAGLSAALPGSVASQSELPVIGVPISAGTLGGIDALLSIAQMPPGVPVATVGIDNSRNAAHLALRLLRLAGSGTRV